ncbi:hypothetical protein EI94DRAFT_1697357 [Lactarius quietus]|nr:hypothetical protein EI94DRAFT_1697357 [Lactarius quietus]
MREMFSKVENEPTVGSSRSSPLSPLTPTESTHLLILKPLGEVGHNGRGGYSLKEVLRQHGWEDELYNKIRERASNEFPILLEYKGNWVIHDYLHTYLKNCAQKAKKSQQLKETELEIAAMGKAKDTEAKKVVKGMTK